MPRTCLIVVGLILCSPLVLARKMSLRREPVTDAQRAATGDTGYPCVASGPMIAACKWYFDFVKENPKPPKSLKEPYIYGGTNKWHGPDPEVKAACEKNYNTICVQKHPLCDEHFDLCD